MIGPSICNINKALGIIALSAVLSACSCKLINRTNYDDFYDQHAIIEWPFIHFRFHPLSSSIFYDFQIKRDDQDLLLWAYSKFSETELKTDYNLEILGFIPEEIDDIRCFWLEPSGEKVPIRIVIVDK